MYKRLSRTYKPRASKVILNLRDLAKGSQTRDNLFRLHYLLIGLHVMLSIASTVEEVIAGLFFMHICIKVNYKYKEV